MSFACKKLCGHNLRRPHLTCLYCRIRRLYYGKLDEKKYHYNRFMGLVMPPSYSNYVLIIDNNRRFARVKDILLKYVLTIAEALSA
jgi:hypothetical protein